MFSPSLVLQIVVVMVFIKYLNMQRISKRKTSLLYSIDTTASPTDSSSVTLGLRVGVQPAKPDSPVRLLCDQLAKVYVFSAHKIFTIFVLFS